LAAWVDIEFLIYRKLDKFNSQISKTVKKITFNLSLESMIIPRYLNFENNLDFFSPVIKMSGSTAELVVLLKKHTNCFGKISLKATVV